MIWIKKENVEYTTTMPSGLSYSQIASKFPMERVRFWSIMTNRVGLPEKSAEKFCSRLRELGKELDVDFFPKNTVLTN